MNYHGAKANMLLPRDLCYAGPAPGIFQPGHTRLPQQDWDLKAQAETPFPYLHALSPLFRPMFCVLPQQPCVHYTELFVGFVGRSLTKSAQIVDIFSSIIGVFFTHLSSYSQRQVSFPLPFSLFLPAHDCHLTCPILTFYYSYFLPCVLWANEI